MALPSLTLLGQSLLSGLFIGALYGLLGLGLSLSWGMLRQINLAHFALAFLGAYLTYQLAGAGMNPLATLAVVVPFFFALGALMHWLLARFSVSAFNSLLVTFGLTAIIEALIQWIWTADFRRMESAYGEVKFRVGALYVALPELLTLTMALALSLAAWAWLRHTYTGKAMRAIAEDAPIAAAFGVDVRRLSLLLSGLSAAFAGVAGLALALSYTLAPGQIYAWLGVVFATVMLGGLGNPLGPLVAGIVIIFTGFDRADAIASLVVAVLMFRSGFDLQRKAIRVLLEGAPEGMPPNEIGVAMAQGEHVKEVHDLHVWELAPGHPILTAQWHLPIFPLAALALLAVAGARAWREIAPDATAGTGSPRAHTGETRAAAEARSPSASPAR